MRYGYELNLKVVEQKKMLNQYKSLMEKAERDLQINEVKNRIEQKNIGNI